MCGCTGGSVVIGRGYKSYQKSCGGKIPLMIKARNTLAILYNKTKDTNKREDYQEAINELNDMIKVSEDNCPDQTRLTVIIDYAEDEYREHS